MKYTYLATFAQVTGKALGGEVSFWNVPLYVKNASIETLYLRGHAERALSCMLLGIMGRTVAR